MSTTKKVIIGILTPILLCCLISIVWLCVYYLKGWNNNISLTTNYVDELNLIDSEDPEYFIDIEYFSNENNNGIENFSAKLNYYTDTKMPTYNEDGTFAEDKYYYSSGIQFKKGFTFSQGCDVAYNTKMYDRSKGWYQFYKVEPTNCYYYNIDNQTEDVFRATNKLEDQNKWVYDLDGQLCLIESCKTEDLKSGSFIFKNRRVCDINYCLLELYRSVKSLDEGIHVVSFDLSRFFNIKMFNTNTGKFDVKATGDVEWTFVKVRVNKSNNGFVSAEQSIFSSYQGNPDWTLYELGETDDYWQVDNIYHLNLSQMTFDYIEGKNYLRLQTSTLEFLETFDNMQFYLDLDLDNIYLNNEELYIDGFSENAFGTLNIVEIKLYSEQIRTFISNDSTLNIISSPTITLGVAV